MISRAKLHAMQIEVLTKKGRTDPMPETEVNGILFKMNTDLRALKKGEADGALIDSLREGFLLPAWAARDVPVGEGQELIKARQLACDAAFKALTTMKADGRHIAKGGEIKTLDEGYTAAVELYDTLPEWCFLKAGLDYWKMQLGLHRKRGRRKWGG